MNEMGPEVIITVLQTLSNLAEVRHYIQNKTRAWTEDMQKTSDRPLDRVF